MRKPLSSIFPQVPADIDITRFNSEAVPKHVAIIMDGNGRWAKKRALNRLKGHKAGIEAVREAIRAANDIGVDFLTIYSFSTENWKRSEEEVSGLMDLFAKTMLAEVDELHKEQVRVCTIGDTSKLPKSTQEAFDEAWDKTKDNAGMTLVVAINYGSRQEILRAVAQTAHQLQSDFVQDARDGGTATTGISDVPAGGDAVSANVQSARGGRGMSAEISVNDEEFDYEALERVFTNNLYTANIPDPDLLIRTSGEMRLSNFLLWQVAYTEFYCTDVLWPDFNRYDFLRAVLAYQSRERRYGAV